jgi:large-conductance mechanosensitive channel
VGIRLVREGNTVNIGSFISPSAVNLLIIGLVCFGLVKLFVREKEQEP